MKFAMYNVLVLGHDSRSTLSVIRSLGRAGFRVDLGTFSQLTPCRFSKYVNETYLLPDTANGMNCFQHSLKCVIQMRQYNLVVPTTDEYLVPVMKFERELSKFAKLAVPPLKAFEASYKKAATIELARANEIPIPRTFEVQSPKDFCDIPQDIVYPMIVKPNSSKIWVNDYRLDLTVKKVFSRKELEDAFYELYPFVSVLIQEYVPGLGVGQEFLARSGDIIQSFQHIRIHEPKEGGGSSYRVSTEIFEKLYEYSKRLIKAMNYSGVLMVEYRCDFGKNTTYLMEINGRFWGSLPLAINSGVDFPLMLAFSILDPSSLRSTEYSAPKYCRNLVKDMKWYLKDGKLRNHGNIPIKYLPSLQGNIAYRIVHGIESFDVYTNDDRNPGLMEIPILIFQLLIEKLVQMKYRIIRRLYTNQNRTDRKRIEEIPKLLRNNPSILFVCWGNISRSVYAEHKLKKILQECGRDDIEVESGGIIGPELRKASPFCMKICKEEGIDVSTHRSRRINKTIVNNAGTIFVMDSRIYHHIHRKYGLARDKLFFLSGVNGSESATTEIDDPYGKDYGAYQHVFAQISESVSRLVDIIIDSNSKCRY